MTEQPLKILVCGDVEGKFTQLFTRVKNVIKKAGPFEMLLCIGDFYSTSETALAEWKLLQSGELKVPIATYILGPNTSDQEIFFDGKDGCEICENLTYLGKRGIYSTASGLQIAYISGVEHRGNGPHGACHFTRSDVDALGLPLVANSKFKGVDILLTSQWPGGVTKYTSNTEEVRPVDDSRLMGDLALALRPRYHFSALQGFFYERIPYRNHRVLAESNKHVTRFLGLAKVGNPKKQKYLYAFNITPMTKISQEELTKQPEVVTECPFTWSEKPKEEKRVPTDQYFFSTNQGSKQQQHRGQKRHQHQKQGGEFREKRPMKKHPQPTGPCWFCLGSPQVEKHLVVSVGTSCYVALAKGGLVSDHCLVLPIGHYQSTLDVPEDVKAEMEQYKTALRKCFQSIGKSCVIYERNYRTQHLQLQVVPIDKSKSDQIKDVFFRLGDEHKLELAEIPTHTDLKQILSVGSPYFYAELDSGEKILHRIKKFFPLQFGREAMASEELLDMPERVNWKNCSSTKEEETEMTATFRKQFEAFDLDD